MVTIGRLKTGEKTTKGDKTFPKSLDYFKATGPHSDTFHRALGNQPNTVDIVFYADDCFGQGWKYVDNKGVLIARTVDDINFTVWSDKANRGQGGYLHVEAGNVKVGDKEVSTREYIEHTYPSDRGWMRETWMEFLIPATGLLGLWRYETTSEQTGENLTKYLDMVLEVNNTLHGVPFKIGVEMKEGKTPKGTKKYPIVTISAKIPDNAIQNFYKELGVPVEQVAIGTPDTSEGDDDDQG